MTAAGKMSRQPLRASTFLLLVIPAKTGMTAPVDRPRKVVSSMPGETDEAKNPSERTP
jgi:hypothetical protein